MGTVNPAPEDAGPENAAPENLRTAEPQEAPELPRGLALAWGVAASPNRGPRRELSIERIVDAAIELADADGLDGVSMAKVAGRLGYTTMSLYRYVTSKDDLLLLMQEQVLDVEGPPAHEPSDWRAELREWVLFTKALLDEHPWYLDVPIRGVPLTPNNLRIVDSGLRALRSTALGQEEKMSAILLGSGYALTSARMERDLRRAVQSADDDDTALGSAYGDTLRQLVDPARFPNLWPLVESGTYVGEGAIDDVAFGLERLLDGVATYVDARAAGAPGAGQDLERSSGVVRAPGTAGAAASAVGTLDGSDEDVRATERVVAAYARDPRVRKAAEKRRDAEKRVHDAKKEVREAEKRVREAQKRVDELAKAVREASKAEADAARAAADRAARD
jgi:AcrR family transcriptional regulator